MRKNILMLTCSVLSFFSVCQRANALTANEQLKALKEVFVKSFETMDDDKDGKISKKEYLKHQFEQFRINIMEADSFDSPLNDKLLEGIDISSLQNTNEVKENKETKEKVSSPKKTADNKTSKQDKSTPENVSKDDILGNATDIMEAMANYTLEPNTPEQDLSRAEKEINAILEEEGVGELTKEDVMPELNELNKGEELPKLEKLDFELPENNLDIIEKPSSDKDTKDKEIEEMMSVIKKTLPKKIDEITSWTDIEYNNKIVTYIYKADVDTSTFKPEEKEYLAKNIKEDACVNAYATMCQKIKPMFIDVGINMQIRYIDKKDQELSSCEFNETTCK